MYFRCVWRGSLDTLYPHRPTGHLAPPSSSWERNAGKKRAKLEELLPAEKSVPGSRRALDASETRRLPGAPDRLDQGPRVRPCGACGPRATCGAVGAVAKRTVEELAALRADPVGYVSRTCEAVAACAVCWANRSRLARRDPSGSEACDRHYEAASLARLVGPYADEYGRAALQVAEARKRPGVSVPTFDGARFAANRWNQRLAERRKEIEQGHDPLSLGLRKNLASIPDESIAADRVRPKGQEQDTKKRRARGRKKPVREAEVYQTRKKLGRP